MTTDYNCDKCGRYFCSPRGLSVHWVTCKAVDDYNDNNINLRQSKRAKKQSSFFTFPAYQSQQQPTQKDSKQQDSTEKNYIRSPEESSFLDVGHNIQLEDIINDALILSFANDFIDQEKKYQSLKPNEATLTKQAKAKIDLLKIIIS